VVLGNIINDIYALLRDIGANYKMSVPEFDAKFKMFKKMHLKCGEECLHVDVWYKKLLL